MNIRPNIFILPVSSPNNIGSIKSLLRSNHLQCSDASHNGDLAVAVQFSGGGHRDTIISVAKTFAKPELIEIDTARLATRLNSHSGATDVLGTLVPISANDSAQNHIRIGNGTALYGFSRVLRKTA